MPRRTDEEQWAKVPFPVAPVSNGEWLPQPFTAKQFEAAKRIAEAMDRGAKRHGMTRMQFLRTAAATLTAFGILNEVHGLPSSGDASAMPIPKEHCDDTDGARELLDKDVFIMDVQQHHVDLNMYGSIATQLCSLRFLQQEACTSDPSQLGQLNFVKEVFIDSHTDVGVISGLPAGIPMGPAAMAETGQLVNQLAGSQRALWQVVCDPKNPAGTPTAIDQIAYQVNELKTAKALKCYTYSGNWRLDDEQVAYPMLQEATRNGIKLINVHKGLPAIFAAGSPQSVRAIDIPKVVRDWPKLKFCCYHSAYFPGNEHPEGKTGLTEIIEVLNGMPRKQRRNVYLEIGSTFAITYLSSPDTAAHLLGQLLKTVGPRNILWGTDSIWWGSPQWLIDAFMLLQIPASMQEQYGYPALTMKIKKMIFGENAARLYGVKPRAERCTIPLDRLQTAQIEQGGARNGRSLNWYGPQTRRGFFAYFKNDLDRFFS